MPGWVSYVQMFWDDTTGVRDIFGSALAPESVLEDIREEAEFEGQLVVEVSADVVRGIYQSALEVNARTGHPLPPHFELWEPYVHERWPIADDEPVETAELDDAPYRGRADLITESAALLEHEIFETWSFSMMDTLRGMAMAEPPKGKKLTNAQYEPLLEALVDPNRRRLLRSRLRRQAWMLDRMGATRERDLALAVSASLQSVSIIDLVEHPFLRRMVDISVEMSDPFGTGTGGLPPGMGIADLLGGALGTLPDLGDDWLDDDFDEEFDDLADLDEDDLLGEAATGTIIEFPSPDKPPS
jgi:hypothetical protein